jgi:FkbM family methyltransferase
MLRSLNVSFTSCIEMDLLRKRSIEFSRIERALALSEKDGHELIRYLKIQKAQLMQDLFVLSHLGFKRNGFFVEFGATDGVSLSNSHLLEKEFDWSGILVEPARSWHEDLMRNRSCTIETDCVWRESNAIVHFNQVDAAELSTISEFSELDSHRKARKTGVSYDVKTITLNDLLEKHNAPAEIDYLSIDTEGSEFEILSHFDFSKHKFKVITCEHNYTDMREKIFGLLEAEGYVRVFRELSMFDDWYVAP